jgi:hypothetical protein
MERITVMMAENSKQVSSPWRVTIDVPGTKGLPGGSRISLDIR